MDFSSASACLRCRWTHPRSLRNVLRQGVPQLYKLHISYCQMHVHTHVPDTSNLFVSKTIKSKFYSPKLIKHKCNYMINYKFHQDFYFHIKNPIKKEKEIIFLFLIFQLDLTAEKGPGSFFFWPYPSSSRALDTCWTAGAYPPIFPYPKIHISWKPSVLQTPMDHSLAAVWRNDKAHQCAEKSFWTAQMHLVALALLVISRLGSSTQLHQQRQDWPLCRVKIPRRYRLFPSAVRSSIKHYSVQ